MGLAARKLDDVLYDVSITDNASTPVSGYLNIVMGLTDSIEFTNQTTYPVSITFTTTSGNVLSSIATLPAGSTSAAQSPQMNNVTVNYTITNLTAGKTSTPCGVQVGVGALRINILAANTNPDPVSIPRSGQIQFHPDVSYQITFTPPNAFTPTINSISPPSSPVLTATNLAPLATYTIKGGGPKDSNGKGTVKIGS
jgi:hypothetical protein